MKIDLRIVLSSTLCLALASARAQFGPGGGSPPSPSFGGSMAKLFGENSSFTANVEMQVESGAAGQPMVMPGKVAVTEGKTRFEADMSSRMPRGAAAMGIDKTVMISRPDLKVNYMIFPSLQAYVEMAATDPEAAKPQSDFKIDLTELGKETFDGHPCIKNKAVVTDTSGNKHEATLWNATDLNKFPIKIEQNEEGKSGTILFKDIKLGKPDASLFEPPADYTKYDSMQAMMQQVMMKRYGRGAGATPPPHPPQP
jgi:hypothetical protein